jgi:NADPH-dependent F420 reductase
MGPDPDRPAVVGHDLDGEPQLAPVASVPATSVSSRPSTSKSCVAYSETGPHTGPQATTCIDSAAVSAPVCIVGGTGALGYGLAVRLARAGVPIAIGSRDAARAVEAAKRARTEVPEGSFTGLQNAEAVTKAELVILSVPFRSQSETMTNLKNALSDGQLLVDATVPLAAAVSGKATRTLGVWQGSAAQQAQEMAPPGVRVISAFHSVSAALLSDLDHQLDEDVLICGDRKQDKARLIELVDRIPGLRGVDCGPLEMARIVEQFTPLLISINIRNKVRAGIKITGL